MRPAILATALLVVPAYAQQQTAVFHAATVVLPGDSEPFQRLGDFDGDGDLDAVGTRIPSSGTSRIKVWRNDAGVFTEVWTGTFSYGAEPTSNGVYRGLHVEVADLNFDGLDDFAIGGTRVAEVFLSQPGFTFARASTPNFAQLTTTALESAPIAIGDFDNDGLWDLVLMPAPALLQQPLLCWWGGGASTLTYLQGVPFLNSVPDRQLRVADFDGDGADDLLLTLQQATGGMAFLLRAPQRTFVRQSLGNIPSVHPTVGDVDNDGDADVVLFGASGSALGQYSVMRNPGTGALVAEPWVLGGPAEYLADIDGDGDLDGVCCGSGSGGGNPVTWPQLNFPSVYEIAINRGAGDFAPAWTMAGAGSKSLAGAADIDGDGDVDLVAGRCVLSGRGPWTEAPQPAALPLTPSLLASFARDRDVHDHDRDGDLDVSANHRDGFENLGDGSVQLLAATAQPPAGKTWSTPVSIDVDGDGIRDSLVHQSAAGVFEKVVWLRGNGGGHYKLVGDAAAPGLRLGFWTTNPLSDHMLVADADGDGDEDLIANKVPYLEGWGSQVFWNQGGTFEAGPSFVTTGSDAERIEGVADFDGDQRPDLLMVGSGTMNVRAGTGIRQSPFALAWSDIGNYGYEPAAISIADLDGDGKPDILCKIGNELHWFANVTPPLGAIAFAAGAAFPPSLGSLGPAAGPSTVPAYVHAGDLDGDGWCDVFASQVESTNALLSFGVSILQRRDPQGAISWELHKQVVPTGLVFDADGDGDLDLVSDRLFANVLHHGHSKGHCKQIGFSTHGEAGAAPRWGAFGPFRAGEVERLVLRGIPGPTLCVLGMSLGGNAQPNVPMPGLTLRLDIATLVTETVVVSMSGQGRAAASAEFAIGIPPGLQGLEFHSQAFVFDASVPGGLTCTNSLVQRFGN